MKTRFNSVYVKGIKAQIKVINESLKRVAEAEEIQLSAVNINSYNEAKRDAQDACLNIMSALEEAVRIASDLGCYEGLYDINTIHKVVEKNLNIPTSK